MKTSTRHHFRLLSVILSLFLFTSFLATAQDCEIDDLEAEVDDCYGTEFWAEVEFDYEDVSDMFNLWVNGADSVLF